MLGLLGAESMVQLCERLYINNELIYALNAITVLSSILSIYIGSLIHDRGKGG